MKIAFVIPAFLPARGFGGPLHHLHAIAKVLIKKGHSIVIYTSNLANPTDLSETLLEKEYINGILVKRYPVICKIAGYWITPSMVADLKGDEYDILHAHLARSFQCDLAAFVSKLKRKPFLITAHGSLGSHLHVDRGQRIRTLHIAHDFIARSVFNAADKVIALNQFEKQNLIQIGVDINKIAIISNGIQLDEFKKGYYNFKGKYGIEGKFVLFVGRLDMVKGLDALIRAFHLVKRQNFHDVKLIIVGEDWGLKKSLLELCKQYNISTDVLFLDKPTREDIISALHASDIFVLPSNYETFSIAILEAAACAKPIVATTVGGIPEIVVNGVNGILVRPRNSVALAKAIIYLLRNEDVAEKMGLAGEKLVTGQFSIERVTDELENLYKNLVSPKKY